MKPNRILPILISLLVVYCFFIGCNQKIELRSDSSRVALSAIRGQKSKIDTLLISNDGKTIDKLRIQLAGEHAHYFQILSFTPIQLEKNKDIKISIQFQPDSTFIGLANAELLVGTEKDSVLSLPLHGLSTKALEGKNEPPLSWVVNTLGYGIDIGWNTLGNHIRADLVGEEITQSLFKKAKDGVVELIPVARYSPPFNLPFGYYTIKNNKPILTEIGVLSDSKLYPEHQTLFPEISSGSTSFDPKSEAFGLYTTSPSHDAFSEDKWNKSMFKDHASHACRIYPIKNLQGTLVPNEYLICFEEASNGDYQDYVFVIKNVDAV